ncbi:MAG: hypothetical protein VXW31_06430 [Planctomycetota bacterium]|nr:hypothetical protein [Planctomycetota bacterium]
MSTYIDRTAPGAGEEGAPPPDELLAMAFADGELSPEERLAFEQRMVREEGLARLVSEHMALDVLARRVAPKEPQDHEWERLRLNPLFVGTRSSGWALLALGSVTTLALTVFGVATNESLSIPTRVGILGALLGFLLLFLTVAARRLRTLPLDPYRHVER